MPSRLAPNGGNSRRDATVTYLAITATGQTACQAARIPDRRDCEWDCGCLDSIRWIPRPTCLWVSGFRHPRSPGLSPGRYEAYPAKRSGGFPDRHVCGFLDSPSGWLTVRATNAPTPTAPSSSSSPRRTASPAEPAWSLTRSSLPPRSWRDHGAESCHHGLDPD